MQFLLAFQFQCQLHRLMNDENLDKTFTFVSSSLVFPKLVCGQPRNEERETNVIHRDFISRERVSERAVSMVQSRCTHAAFCRSVISSRRETSRIRHTEISACRNQISLH